MPSDRYFLGVAKAVAEGSKDPSTKIGAVIVDKNGRIIATGFNGFPPGIADDDRLNDRAEKYPRVVHAEVNAICQAGLLGCYGNSLFVYGLPPCDTCAPLIVSGRFARVAYMMPVGKMLSGKDWVAAAKFSQSLFSEAGIEFIGISEEDPLTD